MVKRDFGGEFALPYSLQEGDGRSSSSSLLEGRLGFGDGRSVDMNRR
jgi:hypothetical protein